MSSQQVALSDIIVPGAIAAGQENVPASVQVAAQQDLAAGRLPFTAGSLSDLASAALGLPSVGTYTPSQLANARKSSGESGGSVSTPSRSPGGGAPSGSGGIAPPFNTSVLGSRPRDFPPPEFGSGGCDVSQDPLCLLPTPPDNSGTESIVGVIGALIAAVNNRSSDIIHSIYDAIGGAIGGITSALTNVSGAITTSLDNAVMNIGQFIGSAFQGLGDTLNGLFGGIGNAIGSVGTAIVGGLHAVLDGAVDALKGIWGTIHDKFDQLFALIQQNGAAAIIPVLQGIIAEIQNVRNIWALIEQDIHGNIGTILTSVQGITGQLQSIDATFNRVLQQLSTPPGVATQSTIQIGDFPVPKSFLDSLKSAFGEVAGDPSATVSALNIGRASGAACAGVPIVAAEQYREWYAKANPVSQWIADALWWGLMALASVVPTLEQLNEIQGEEVQKNCRLTKFDPRTAAEAVLRGFITPARMEEELAKQGWPNDSITVFRELTQQRLGADILVDSRFRNIIDDSTFTSGLAALGFTPSQQEIVTKQAGYLPTLADLLRWLDFDVFDNAGFTVLAETLRIPPAISDRILQTYQTPETLEQEANLAGRKNAISTSLHLPSVGANPPEEVLRAARRARVTPGNAGNLWLAHWNIPSWVLWLQSYFRNLRTLGEVQGAMQAENIPPELWDELVKINRPLLPFRSIPLYVRNGIISLADATLELEAHGFDPLHISWILKAAQPKTTAAVVKATNGAASLSLVTAKTFFEDGALTEQQYIAILEAHGYPQDLAQSVADAELLAAHAKARKQELTDTAAQVFTGALSVDDAVAKLTTDGFTSTEISRWQVKVSKQLTVGAPRVSLGELKTFLKAAIIDLPTYKAELQKLGWQSPYLDWFVQLETPPEQLPSVAGANG